MSHPKSKYIYKLYVNDWALGLGVFEYIQTLLKSFAVILVIFAFPLGYDVC
jgi:hypothetical protein